MRKFGFVFPGQGSQKIGMLNGLAEQYSIIGQTFDEASQLIGQDLWEIAQHDSGNKLDQTQITQPVLLTASVAIWRLWQDQGAANTSILAGHSLGEYSALVCAGVLEFGDAVKLVRHRGEYMQQTVQPGQGAMAAIVGLDDYKIKEIWWIISKVFFAFISAHESLKYCKEDTCIHWNFTFLSYFRWTYSAHCIFWEC